VASADRGERHIAGHLSGQAETFLVSGDLGDHLGFTFLAAGISALGELEARSRSMSSFDVEAGSGFEEGVGLTCL
jgi:hypothetical protein